MQQPDTNISSEKENRKVRTNKQFQDNEVKEGTDESVNNVDSDKTVYPHDNVKDKQHNNQPEFIDRNNDSKDENRTKTCLK